MLKGVIKLLIFVVNLLGISRCGVTLQLLDDNTDNAFSLQSMEIALLEFNFNKIPLTYKYNSDWTLEITYEQAVNDKSEYVAIDLPEFFTLEKQNKHTKISLQILNYTADKLNFLINILYDQQGDFKAKVSSLIVLINKKNPGRAQVGSNNFFAFILASQFLNDIMLPFNMPPVPEETGPIIDLQFKKDIDFYYKKPVTQQPYDQSYWSNIQVILTPWLPFFSFCQDYGSHINLFDILEYSTECNLIQTDQTKIVAEIPISGFEPISDECYQQVLCQLQQDSSSSTAYRGSKWWQAQNTQLFYIASNSLDSKTFFSQRTDQDSNTFLKKITQSADDIIPVKFNSAGYEQDSIPRTVQLIIRYNQISVTEKRILKASVEMSDYYKPGDGQRRQYQLILEVTPMGYFDLMNAFQFSVPIYLFLFGVLSILTVIGIVVFWFINQMLSRIRHPPTLKIYASLQIIFIPVIVGSFIGSVPYFFAIFFIKQLFDSQFFNLNIIFFRYDREEIDEVDTQRVMSGRLGLMLIIMGGIFIYYGANLIIPVPSRQKEKIIQKNIIRLKKEYQLIYNDQQKEMPSRIIEKNSKEINGSADEEENFENDGGRGVDAPYGEKSKINKRQSGYNESITQNNNRQPNSMKASNQNMQQSLSKNYENTEQSGESYVRNRQIREKSMQKSQLQYEENDIEEDEEKKTENKKDDGDDDDDDDQEDEEMQINVVLGNQRFHFMMSGFISCALFLFALEFSYTDTFKQNILVFLVVNFFLEAVFILTLQHYILKETLLIQPISATLETIQFLMFMAASSLQFFILSYLVRIALIIFFRTYIDPILKNLEFFVRKFVKWVETQDPRLKAFVGQYLRGVLEKNAEEENIKNYVGYVEKSQNLFQGDTSLENILNQLLSYSAKIHAILMKPIFVGIVDIFARETQMPKLFEIKYSEFNFYLYFAILIIIPQVIIDIFVMNSLELIHGFKLYDYFDYCQYRYNNRTNAWVGSATTLDRSLDINYRSLDNMFFSDQFYFIGTITIFGLLSITLGASVMIRNQYIFFADPIIWLMTWFFLAVVIPFNFIIRKIWNQIDYWKVKNEKEKPILQSTEGYLQTYNNFIQEIIDLDLVKERFIEANEEFLIQNLDLVIDKHYFQENDEYLLKLYIHLSEEEQKLSREQKRNEMIRNRQLEIRLMREKRKRGMKDDEDEEQLQKELIANPVIDNPEQEGGIIKRINKDQEQIITKIIYHWYFQAQQIVYLKNLVRHVREENLEKKCRKCPNDIPELLNLVEIVPLMRLMNIFRGMCTSRPFNQNAWIAFFKKNQKFITLCMDCETAYRQKKVFKENQDDQNKNNRFRDDQNKNYDLNVQPFVKIILRDWLYQAQSLRLLQGEGQEKQLESMLFEKEEG